MSAPSQHRSPTVLTIAGSDSGGGAGVQLDLKVFQALGMHGASVVTALTAQNTAGVTRIHRVPPRFVGDQIDAVARDQQIGAVKTGMLDRSAIVTAVAERVRRRDLPNLVIDPVILAKDGTPLLQARGVEMLKKLMLPKARVITPNVPEAEALSGVCILNEESLREAARRIAGLGPVAVVIKGGHLPGEPVDLLLERGEFFEFPGQRIGGPPVHGTGCAYSAVLAVCLAQELPLPKACAFARQFMERAIREAIAVGRGARVIGPLRGTELLDAPERWGGSVE